MAGLSVEQKSEIWEMTTPEALTVQQITTRLGLSGRKAYQQVYKFLTDTQAKTKYLFEKVGSLLWVRANPRGESSFFSDSPLDLICNKQSPRKTELIKKTDSRQHAPLENIKRASPERLSALLKLNRIQSFGHFERTETGDLEWVKHNNVEEEIKGLFTDYNKRTKAERLDMAYSPTGSPVFAENYTMPYKTRFNDKGRQDANKQSFRWAWGKASKKHCVACELTLTARPYGWDSLNQCNAKTLEALEKMIPALRYHCTGSMDYICVREYQKSGRIHFHLTLFGENWITHKGVIQYTWRGYGGGEILDIHTIRRRGSSWVWSGKRPDDSAGLPPYDYLRKYLEKSMDIDSGYMFWVQGIRNWTCSKSLQPKRETPQKKDQPKKHFLKGIKSKITGYRNSNRSDTKAFFAGAYVKVKKVLTPKPKPTHPKPEKPDTSFRRACELPYNP